MLAVHIPRQRGKGCVQIVVGVAHFHSKQVDPFKGPPAFLRTDQKMHERVQQSVVDVVAGPIDVDVPVFYQTEAWLSQHGDQDRSSQVATGWHVRQRAKHVQGLVRVPYLHASQLLPYTPKFGQVLRLAFATWYFELAAVGGVDVAAVMFDAPHAQAVQPCNFLAVVHNVGNMPLQLSLKLRLLGWVSGTGNSAFPKTAQVTRGEASGTILPDCKLVSDARLRVSYPGS